MSEIFTPALSTKSSQLEKRVEGFCLIITPVLFAASTFFWQNGEYGVEAAVLIIFSMFFWIPALKSLFSLVKNEMPRYAVWGLWIAVFGCIGGVCFAFLGYLATVFNISHERLQSRKGDLAAIWKCKKSRGKFENVISIYRSFSNRENVAYARH